VPQWKSLKLSEIEPKDVRELFMAMRNEGKTKSMIKKTRASLSALFEVGRGPWSSPAED
jgi:hypothetical protein